ncbi:Transketolase-like, pyrimidine-binding domain containing protein [uncultured Caudovirales phage]|uniref:Transketolase-like, pyrimidine-binding domain containing protein n=1 Tax=uncultured Caudovirales phage TaxID=2100421 RepID=A0A6J5L3M4_9CAUD|nr:Transketolase-like, pyrimidine-binding domain containing protein [uncultured Caudovirales phage]
MSNKLYNDQLKATMNWLAEQEHTMFLGQAVCYAGTGCYESLTEVPANKKMEFPVAENFQIGVSTGLAINGFVPISVVPRWNFLLCATDQIVNHLDKMSRLSAGRCQPKVIIRVAVGSETPVDPQDQHKGNFADAFRLMCKTIDIIECPTPESIQPAYELAYNRTDGRSTIVVEFPDYGK